MTVGIPFVSISKPDIEMSGVETSTYQDVGYGVITSQAAAPDQFYTQLTINWGGLVLPGYLADFLGYSYPFYTVSASDQYGSAETTPAQQLGLDVYGNPIQTDTWLNLANLEAPGQGAGSLLYQNMDFTASPLSTLAVTQDVVYAVLASSGVASSLSGEDVTALHSLLDTVAEDLNGQYQSAILNAIDTAENDPLSFPAQFSQLMQTMLPTMEQDLLSLEATLSGSLANALLSMANKDAGILAALGPFVYDFVALIAVVIKGELTDTYTVADISPTFTYVFDPNLVVDALLKTPTGTVGYSDGQWQNPQNVTGFMHSNLANGTYGFWIPVKTTSYNASLTIRSENGSSTQYAVSIYYGNDSRLLTGTLHGNQSLTTPLEIAHGQLVGNGSNLTQEYLLYGAVGVASIFAVAVAFVGLRRRKARLV